MTSMQQTQLGTLSYGEPSASNNNAGSNVVGIDDLRRLNDANVLLNWGLNSYKQAKHARQRIEKQWYINLAFLFGRQNAMFMNSAASSTGYRLITPPAPPWRKRLIVNKVRGYARRQVSRLVSQKPTFIVVPATNDDDDQAAAVVAQLIFESAYSSANVSREIRRMAWWLTATGIGYLKCYWDPTSVGVGYDNQQTTGEIKINKITPFHIFVPDLLECSIEDQPFIIHAATKSKEYIERYFGSKVSSKAVIKSTNDILEDLFLDLTNTKPNLQDQVLCLEVWVKPGGHKLFPNGGVFTIVGDQLIQMKTDGMPYKHNDYPFIKFGDIDTGKYYGESMITDLISPQREYNLSISQIAENRNLMSKIKLLAAEGQVNPNMITDQPGQVILYKSGFPFIPTVLPPVNLPSYVSESIARTQNDMDDIAGQHEVSRGDTPPQVTAATAISYLQEQDDTMLGTTIDDIEDGMRKLGNHYLCHVVQFWDVPRLVKVAGDSESFDAQFFQGSQLRNNVDVRVEAGSALPSSKAAKQAFLMDLFKLGAIPPEQLFQMLDLKGVEKAVEDYKVDVNQVRRENTKMRMGLQVPINDFDNDAIHIDFHDKFRKSQAYEMLNPQIQQIFQTHVGMHQAAQTVKMQTASAANGQIGAAGLPPEIQQQLAQNPQNPQNSGGSGAPNR